MLSLAFEKPKSNSGPLFLQVADMIVGEIQRGRLKPGTKLPGTRSLAQSLKVNRNTIDTAYKELIAQGWLRTTPASGTFICETLPPDLSCACLEKGGAANAGDNQGCLAQRLNSEIFVTDGQSDPRLLPHIDMRSAFGDAVMSTRLNRFRQTDNPRGLRHLRAETANYLSTARGIACSEQDLLITRGSQMALFLISMTMLSPGDTVAVEMPGYRMAWDCFEAAGANVDYIPVDHDGLDVEEFAERLANNQSIKAIYVTPHHQFPTTITLAEERRAKLLKLAEEHDVLIIEDDYDHEFRYAEDQILPLVASKDTGASILHIGSFSKLLFSGFRLGYVVGNPSIISRMTRYRRLIDRHGDFVLEKALTNLIADGALWRHTFRARKIYYQRLQDILSKLRLAGGDRIQVSEPKGGLGLWVRLTEGRSADQLIAATRLHDFHLQPLSSFYPDRCLHADAFRIGFANLNDEETSHFVHRLADALQHIDDHPPVPS